MVFNVIWQNAPLTFLEFNNGGMCSYQFIMLLYRKQCLQESQSKTLLWWSFVNPRKGRNSHSHMFFKTGVLKIFANFLGKHLRWSLILIKLKTFKRDSNAGLFLFLFLQNTSGGCFWKESEGTSLVKILQSCHFDIFGIKDASERRPLRILINNSHCCNVYRSLVSLVVIITH